MEINIIGNHVTGEINSYVDTHTYLSAMLLGTSSLLF